MTEQPRILGGRYQLGEVLGRGGMAEVRRARDLRLGRDVAIKQLRIDLASDPTFQERFRREAQAAAGLNHPNIVAVYDTGEDPDPVTGVRVPFIVMELVEGRTLRDMLRGGPEIQPTEALTLSQGVLDALSYSHKAGIVHRDIKPANVMLTTDGDVKVMDFGIARAVADTSATMTQTAAVIGTAQYLSPEQARGETVDARSDIYSAGCLLYELLTGRPPFQGDSPVSVAYQHVREAPVPPGQLEPKVTPAMDNIVLKALAKDPADRYQTAAAMRADIGRLLAGQAVLAAPVPAPSVVEATQVLAAAPALDALPEKAEPEHKRRVGLIAFLVALAVVAAGTGIFLIWQSGNTEMTTVPNVSDSLVAAATQRLETAKLTVKSSTLCDDAAANANSIVGRVTKTDPAAGAEVPINTEVTLYAICEPTTFQIPTDLKGQKVAAAEAELLAKGFTNVIHVADTDEDVSAKANEVTGVSPAAGTSVVRDAQITLYYATGKSAVPDFSNLTKAAAAQSATAAGFSNVAYVQEVSTVTPGTVLKQNPAAGTMLARTSKITLTIAVASSSVVPVPPVTPTTP